MAVHGMKIAELKSLTIKALKEAFEFAGEFAFGSCFQVNMFFVKLTRKSSVFHLCNCLLHFAFYSSLFKRGIFVSLLSAKDKCFISFNLNLKQQHFMVTFSLLFSLYIYKHVSGNYYH